MKQRILQGFLSVSLLLVSCQCFSQKLKTYEDPVKYDAKMVRFEKMFVQANLEKNRKNFDQATALYYDCLKLKPSSGAVYYELANIAFEKDRYFEAEENIKKALKFVPENLEYKRFLDDLYVKMGKKR